MKAGVLTALFAACAMGFYTVFHAAASKLINNVLGAVLASVVAIFFGSIFVIPVLRQGSVAITPKGLFFIALSGICAFSVDYLVLRAFNHGLAVSIGGPIIIGGSIAIATLVGFISGDTISFMKIVGILLILLGASLLAAMPVH